MAYYSISIDLAGKPCLVVGGGRVAFRKVVGLVRSGATVTVIAKQFIPRFTVLGERVRRVERGFAQGDIVPEYTLVIGATDSLEVNKAVAAACAGARVLCNIVDNPELCGFIVPAVLRRGPVTIAVSTGGASPFLARAIRKRIAENIGPEYGVLGAVLSRLRIVLRRQIKDPGVRARFWESFFALDPVALVRDRGAAHVEARGLDLIESLNDGRGNS
jgi:siroheme synthase-like protein